MRIPMQNSDKRERVTVQSFGGLDKRGDTPEGSFSDMMNMTGMSYPAIRTRDRRAILDLGGGEVFDIMCMDLYKNGKLIKNALIADCENRIKAFYRENGVFSAHDIANTSSLLTQDEKKTVISGTKVYFFPDNVSYDMMGGIPEPLDFSVSYGLGALEDGYYELTFEPCDIDGNNSEASSPYRRIKRYVYKLTESGEKGELIKAMSFASGISAGDTAEITVDNDHTLDGSYYVVSRTTDNSILVIESERTCTVSTGNVSISRFVPIMDHIVSAGNRLWGCRYGTDREGKFVNEIYASALGDAKNWQRFRGVSTDSFSASVGIPGAFTGAVCMNGYPVFFKEDAIIKVFGSYPSEFTVTESEHRGIEEGSARSAVFVNDDLYYKTHSGIVRYDGGMPLNVDAPLGGERYKNAVAGTVGDRYFVSMESENGEKQLFVYDTQKKIWHKEDNKNIISFCRCGRDLYFLCSENGEKKICSVYPSEEFENESDFSWMCESGKTGFDSPDRKYVSSIDIRLDCPRGSACRVLIEYNGDGVWRVCKDAGGENSAHHIRLRPRRCDFFRIRLEGRGECSVRSITRTLEECSSYR